MLPCYSAIAVGECPRRRFVTSGVSGVTHTVVNRDPKPGTCKGCARVSEPEPGQSVSSKRYLHALVAFAFASNLEHTDAADLGDVPDVRAAARLQVDARNLQQPHPPRTARWLNAHGLDQLRPGIELLVADPHGLCFNAASDQGVGLMLDSLRIEQAHIDIEIETALLGRNVAARNRRDDHARHYVQR